MCKYSWGSEAKLCELGVSWFGFNPADASQYGNIVNRIRPYGQISQDTGSKEVPGNVRSVNKWSFFSEEFHIVSRILE